MKQGMGNQMGLPLGDRVEKRSRKEDSRTGLLWSLEISQGPHGESKRKEEEIWKLTPSFILIPNLSTQVANGHCSKDPPP